jgi:hypothetical protein
MMDWVRNFDWRQWSHPAIAVGLAFAVFAFAIRDRDIATFGLGMAVCGLGELMLGLYFRFNRRVGFTLVGFGVALMLLGLYHLVT